MILVKANGGGKEGVDLTVELERRVAELGKRSTDPDPEFFSSDHVFTA